MKKILAFMLSACLALGMAACGSKTEAPSDPATPVTPAETEEVTEVEKQHIIGVMFHAGKDDELLARQHYLDNYIASVFNVKFVYSDEIKEEADIQAFLNNAADFGAEGILSFITYDIEEEVATCEAKEMYYMMGSETIADEEFNAVCDNPWFLGVVGPGTEEEFNTGYEMVKFFSEQDYGKKFFILTGGASVGNDMHLQRAIGMLTAFEEFCGVKFDQDVKDLAATADVAHLNIGDLEICLVPGYVQIPTVAAVAASEYAKDQAENVLSVYDGSVLRDVLMESHVGVVDCFSEANMHFFDKELVFLAGKYGSLIGPSFAAMYNAVTGHADMLRDNGKAFQINQGFWVCTDAEEYLKMYTLAESLEIQAYNYEDLYSVCAEYNEAATLDDLKALATAYTYDDVAARRGIE